MLINFINYQEDNSKHQEIEVRIESNDMCREGLVSPARSFTNGCNFLYLRRFRTTNLFILTFIFLRSHQASSYTLYIILASSITRYSKTYSLFIYIYINFDKCMSIYLSNQRDCKSNGKCYIHEHGSKGKLIVCDKNQIY